MADGLGPNTPIQTLFLFLVEAELTIRSREMASPLKVSFYQCGSSGSFKTCLIDLYRALSFFSFCLCVPQLAL